MFYDNFVRLANNIKLSPSAAAEKIGFKRSEVTRWKNGSVPRRATLIRIADFFDVSPDELLKDSTNATKKAPSITDEAHKIAEQYSKLDTYSKKAVKSLIAIELERNKSDREDSALDDEAPVEYIRHYFTQAAAGYAAPIDGEDYETIERDTLVPKQADYCIEIAGDSMEPFIRNGQRVYVQRTVDIAEFQPAVWFVDGSVFVKQWCVDTNRTLYLLSANPAREDANITIPRDSDRNVVCLGKVLLNKKLPAPIYY